MGRLNLLGSIFSTSEKLESSRKKHKERTKVSTYQLQQGTFLARLKEMVFYSVKNLEVVFSLLFPFDVCQYSINGRI